MTWDPGPSSLQGLWVSGELPPERGLSWWLRLPAAGERPGSGQDGYEHLLVSGTALTMAPPEWTPGEGGPQQRPPRQARGRSTVLEPCPKVEALGTGTPGVTVWAGYRVGLCAGTLVTGLGGGHTAPSAAGRREGSLRSAPSPTSLPCSRARGRMCAPSRCSPQDPDPASVRTWWPGQLTCWLTHLCSCVRMPAPPGPPSGSAPSTRPGLLRWPGWLRPLGRWLREAEREQAPRACLLRACPGGPGKQPSCGGAGRGDPVTRQSPACRQLLDTLVAGPRTLRHAREV